jgi:Tfp pilus assembly protein PilE
MRRPRFTRDERGETLLELLVAITILGVCVVAIGAGIVASIRIAQIHRYQAMADDALHNYAETLQTKYQLCAAGTSNYYASLLASPDSNFTNPTAAVASWSPASAQFVAGCAAPDSGLQQVTLTLTSVNGYVAETLVVVLRSAS